VEENVQGEQGKKEGGLGGWVRREQGGRWGGGGDRERKGGGGGKGVKG